MRWRLLERGVSTAAEGQPGTARGGTGCVNASAAAAVKDPAMGQRQPESFSKKKEETTRFYAEQLHWQKSCTETQQIF